MRILLVHPSAAYATAEVWTGLKAGLEAEGHTVVSYETASQFLMAKAGLEELGRHTGHEFNNGDVAYRAGHAAYAAVLRYGCQAVVVITGEHWHPDHTGLMRRAGIPVGIVSTESPYCDETHGLSLSLASIVWTNERTSVPRLQEAFDLMECGTQVRYLPVAYDEAVHTTAPRGKAPSHDVVFVGTGFAERVELLEAVDWKDLDVGLYGDWMLLVPSRLNQLVVAETIRVSWLAGALKLLPGGSPLWRYVRGGIIRNDLAVELYRHAAVGVNLFRSSVRYSRFSLKSMPAESMAPRLYELAATGTFTVSEARPEVADIFGDLIPTFENADELTGLLHYWVPRAEERAEISAQVVEIAKPHSYRNRAAQLVRDLQHLME